MTTNTKKKLIEVALPLEAINKASAREKSIRHGHPSTLHLWWARRPLAAVRAVIFAQMVDDPSAHPDLFKTEKAQEKERQRLFRIIEDLVLWENTTNDAVLQQARDEIWQSWRYTCAENVDHPRAKELFDRYTLPAFHDPFAGGGALPLEAQRLGLESYASDLNPVAVLINKAMIEFPYRFAGRAPVHPYSAEDGKSGMKQGRLFKREWKGAKGLAEDVRYYGQWMRDEAEKRIGHLYPKIEVTAKMAHERPDLEQYVGQKLTVIAWLWARTVKSPNPAFASVDVPLASTFVLSSRIGKEAYVEPVINGDTYIFAVKVGKPMDSDAAKLGMSAGKWNAFRCLMSNVPVTYDYIRGEGLAGRMGSRLMAVVAEGDRGRVYISPTPAIEEAAREARPLWSPDSEINYHPRDIKTQIYGLTRYGDLFTSRQLVALNTFSDMVEEVRGRVMRDAVNAGFLDDGKALEDFGVGALAYSDAVKVYLAFAVDKCSDYWSSICTWHSSREIIRNTFGRQAIPMTWDYAEANPFCDSSGNWMAMVDWTWKALETTPARTGGIASQADAQHQSISLGKLVSTDPPYYDNIGYADLSDFFYVWLRRALRPVFPNLFATLAVPKAEELVATPYRHGSKEKAETFFLNGMTHAMHRLAEQAHPAFPVTIYYAFKQAETKGDAGTSSTGWDTFLAAVIEAGFSITGTWPMRTELANKIIGTRANMLASSIILVCRQRPTDASTITRREFVAALKAELPAALAHLQRGNIAPVDLAQAAIGPGMAVYTRYAKVLDAEGKPLPVRAALALINQTLDEALAEQEGDFDSDSRWALAWFEQMAFNEAEFGVANVLAQAKNTGMDGLVEAGIIVSGKGKVRLLRPSELPADWDPTTDKRLTVWEMVHQLIRVLESGGEGAAAALVARLGSQAETARELCYRLYTLCERKKRATEAMAYNGLVQSWPEITRLAQASPRADTPGTGDLFA
jgi:putative DNA methylase